MSAPVLSLSEQKAAMSGKKRKKKKKTIKNVLSTPENLKVEPHIVDSNDVLKLREILERLLPLARLPIQHIANGNKDSKEGHSESQPTTDFKSIRNQLSLGVNDVNRSIKKDLISAVILADDIQPKFLIHHLNLLCTHNKIPFLHMPGLREVTKASLGFPCIAVGLKKNFNDFIEAVEEIKLISQVKMGVSNDARQDIISNSNDKAIDEESDESKNKIDENLTKNDETPFTYLIRSSIKERVFVPENHCNEQTKSEDFIVLDSTNDIKFNNDSIRLETPDLLPKTMEKAAKRQKENLKNIHDIDVQDDSDEDLEVPRKKLKKEWVIDKTGIKEHVRYYTTNITRVPSNPSRTKRNKS